MDNAVWAFGELWLESTGGNAIVYYSRTAYEKLSVLQEAADFEWLVKDGVKQ